MNFPVIITDGPDVITFTSAGAVGTYASGMECMSSLLDMMVRVESGKATITESNPPARINPPSVRKVRIAALNVTVEVPIYIRDWVNFIAVDENGRAWMYEYPPVAGLDSFQVLRGDYDVLPARGSASPHPRLDMFGIDWKATLTVVTK